LEPISGSAGGWCDPKRRRIVVDAGLPADAQVRVLVHELAVRSPVRRMHSHGSATTTRSASWPIRMTVGDPSSARA
jgi:hypothetical protein